LWLFSLEKRRLGGDVTAAYQYLKEPTRKLERDFFTRACCDGTRGNGFKLNLRTTGGSGPASKAS